MDLKDVIEKTRNLLTMESMSSLFYEKFLIPAVKENIIQNKNILTFCENSVILL